MARSEAYDRHPDHVLGFEDAPAAVRVRVGERVLAETHRGLTLLEGRYPAVVYVPREDVRMECLRRVDHSTHCPFKGDAAYFDFRDPARDGPEPVAQVAWSYEDPFDQMEAIRGHLAFYADRAIIESLDD
jgi:uncharacterized protein (DUF427 family)